MTPTGTEAAFSLGHVVGLLIHFAFVAALVSWGRRVAARRRTRGWRIASYLPIVAFVSSMLGLLGTVVGLVSAFGAVAATDASHRAEQLSQGIATAMVATAIGVGLALLLYVTSVIAFLYGTYGPAPDPEPPA